MRLKHFISVFLALLTLSVGQMWADNVVYTFNTDDGIAELGITKPSANDGTSLGNNTYTLTPVSLSATHATTATRVFLNQAGTTLDLRIYKNGGSLSFSVANGYKLTSIEFAGSTVGVFAVDNNSTGTFSSGTWTAAANSTTTSVKLNATATGKINTITVYYELIEDSGNPTISIAPTATNFLSSVEVTLTPSEGATAYYTLNGTDPSSASTQYTAPFTLTETKTVKAIAIKGAASSSIAEKTFTKVTPMTVAEALALTTLPSNLVYIEGIICSATEGNSGISTQYKNATYNISDDGTGVGMIVYRGKYLEGGDITNDNKGKFAVGNKVIVCGNLTKFNNANQLAQNNYLVNLVEKDANPTSISINGNMSITEYALNATTLDYSGLTVKALYNTGYNPVVAAENIEWSFAPALNEAGSKNITITATVGSLSDTKDVTVTVADKELQSIAIQEDPYAPVVYCGAAMPKPTIIATFSNGTEDVTSACSFTEVNMLEPGVHNIVVSYTYGDVNKEVQYELTVNPYSVAAIQSVIPATGNIATSVEGVIRWIQYVNEGGFAKYSISATGSKDDADTLLIYNSYAGKNGNSYINFEHSNDIELGDKVIVSGQFCTYGSNSLKESVTKQSYISSLTKKALSSIAISGDIENTIYNQNEAVNPAGLVVTASYNTGYSADVTSAVTWTAEPETLNTIGDAVNATLTAHFGEETANKDVTVKVIAPSAPKHRVRFWNSLGWDNVKVHIWNSADATEWPGVDALFADGWHYYDVEEGSSILFHSGTGTQTVDIVNITADVCYVLTGEVDNYGHKEVAVDNDCDDRFYVAGTTALTSENWNTAGARLENGSVTFYNVKASDDLQFKVTNGTWKWNRGANVFDGECSNITNWGTDNVGFSTDAPKDITISYNKVLDKICVTTAEPAVVDTRKIATASEFASISGNMSSADMTFAAYIGGAYNAPNGSNKDKELRLYRYQTETNYGGYVTIKAKLGCKIDQVVITVSTDCSVGYSVNAAELPTKESTPIEVSTSTPFDTGTGLNADSVRVVNIDGANQFRIKTITVYYTGDATPIHHYILGGTYPTEFVLNTTFDYTGLTVTAAYDEQGTITAPVENFTVVADLTTTGSKKAEVYVDEVKVTEYDITVNAPENVLVKLYAPSWENVYAYTWTWDNVNNKAIEHNGAWGDCQLSAENDKVGDWWVREMPAGANIIFHNGAGLQTADIENVTADVCYAIYKNFENNTAPEVVANCAVNFYLTGETLVGSWDADAQILTNNQHKFNALAAGTYIFKVTNGDWSRNWGYTAVDQINSNIALVDKVEDNHNIEFTLDAAKNVTIAFNPATEAITVNTEKVFEPNIKFGTNDVKIDGVSVDADDDYNNTWHIATVPGSAGQSFTQSAEYSQVGASSKPAESITFTTTLAGDNETAKVSYVAAKFGGFNNTAGTISIMVDNVEIGSGALDGTNDVIAISDDVAMGKELKITVTNIAKGVKCYGIEYAYEKYEFVALKLFAPRDQTNTWDNVYAYAYNPNNNDAPYVAWPGEQVTTKDAEFYVYNAPKGYNVIFHDNSGMQTNNIVNVQEAKCYVPTEINYTVNPKLVTLAEQCTVDYYVAGETSLTGNDWNPATGALKFDANNQVVFHDVQPGSYKFKVTNGSWAWSIGYESLKSDEGCSSIAHTNTMGDTYFTIEEVQDVTITYYPATREICLGAVTVKEQGTLTDVADMNLYVNESKAPSFTTNITDYAANDVTLTIVDGDSYVAIVDGKVKGIAEGVAHVKLTIAETASFLSVDATFTVTVSEEPVTPPTPTDEYIEIRTGLTAGNYYTVCYPKAMSAIKGATLWSFAGADANMAYLVQEDAPFVAGRPYIIYAESDKLEAIVEGDEEAAGNYNGLYGTLADLNNDALVATGATHILKANELRPIGNGHLDAQRAYIIASEIPGGEPQPAPGKKVRSMPMRQDAATGMDEINASETPVKMIIDGQLYIFRGDKMYNANGQLVK